MARGRMLNKTISLSVKFAQLPDDTARLLATWTIAQLDKRGVFYGDAITVRSLVFPMRADVSIERVEMYLQAMEAIGLTRRFKAQGRVWQHWPGFADNQVGLREDRENSDFPPPPEPPPDQPPANNDSPHAGKFPEEIRKGSAEKPAEGEREGEVEDKDKTLSLGADAPNVTATDPPSAEGSSTATATGAPEAPAQPFKAPIIQSTKVPAIDAYVERFGSIPNAEQVDLILCSVDNLDTWRAVLLDWKTHKWREDNVPGMVDKYRNWGKPTAQPPRSKATREREMTPAARRNARMVQ